MFSRIILKLIDAAILPSLLIFGVKFSSTILLSLYWNLPFSMSSTGLNFNNFSDFYKINLFSNGILFLFTFTALFLALLRLYFLTRENLNPSLSVALVNWGLESITTSLWQSYTRSAVWLALAFSVTLSLFVQGLFDFSSLYLFAACTALLVLGILVFLFCLERDALHSLRKERQNVIVREANA